MPRLQNDQRNQAVGNLTAVRSPRGIDSLFSCSQRAIKRFLFLHRQSEGVQDCSRPGRARVTTGKVDKCMTLTYQRQHSRISTDVENFGTDR